jgi:pimeloyl-ACP methyl ester carboxylesterase
MGAALSLWAAVHAPSRVRSVISISGPPYEPIAEDKAWWRAHRPLVEAGRVDEYFDANVRLRMGEAALARFKARPSATPRRSSGCAPHHASLLALLDETYSRPSGSPTAHASAVRCWSIAGSADHFPDRRDVASASPRRSRARGWRSSRAAALSQPPRTAPRSRPRSARFLAEIGV